MSKSRKTASAQKTKKTTKRGKKGKNMLDNKSLLADLDKVAEARKELEKMQKSALGTIKQTLKNLASLPGVEGFRWSQYVPGFNDGDACEFTLNDLEIRLSGETKQALNPSNEESEDEDEDDEENNDEDWVGVDNLDVKDIIAHQQIADMGVDPAVFLKSVNAIARSLYDIEDLLRSEWGENVQITVTKDGIETDEYDCGY